MTRTHPHGGTVTGALRGRLTAAMALTCGVVAVELLGGWLSGSLALIADAGHAFADAAGIGLALMAATLAQRPTTAKRTFGWQRLEILAAVGNALLLLLVAALVVGAALHRLRDPTPVAGGLMLLVAAAGLLANGIAARLLAHAATISLTARGAYLEVIGDLLGSVAVVTAAVVVITTGWRQADAVASAGVAALIVPRSWALLREATDVLLEAVPVGVDVGHIRAHILDLPGVLDVHDLHAWTITSGSPVLSAHVVVDPALVGDGCDGRILDQLADCLAHHFDVAHSTFQLEPVRHQRHERLMHR